VDFESKIRTIQWVENVSRMVDQTKFPEEYQYVDITTGDDMFDQPFLIHSLPTV